MLDRDDTDRSALKFDIALLLEELESSVVRDRALTLRPCVMPALRLAFCLVVADALSQSALSTRIDPNGCRRGAPDWASRSTMSATSLHANGSTSSFTTLKLVFVQAFVALGFSPGTAPSWSTDARRVMFNRSLTRG